MLTFFRKFFQSKIGIVVTLAFLALIALAFASMDVANTGTFGGVTGGDRVAVVGDRRISTSDLSSNVSTRLEQLRQQDPRISMEAFVGEGGVTDVLDQMVSRWAIAEFASDLGLRAGNRLVDSEIVQISAFRGLDGTFSEEAYRAALRQRGLSEAAVREDLAMGLLARQLVNPAALGARIPDSIATRYAQLLAETRSGRIAALPAAAFLPEGEPSDEQLQAYYTENRTRYIRPERRVLRYVVLDEAALGELPAPTEQQIARRYQRDILQYQATERRSLTQLVVPTEAAAQAIVDEVATGISLEAAAQNKGLATTPVADVEREALAERSSPEAAAAAFTAAEGTLTAPARGSLGWYVFRVEEISERPGLTVDEAREEIVAQLAAEQRRLAFNEATSEIDEAIADGSSLADVADRYELELQTTDPVIATGQIYNSPERAPEVLAPVLQLAFEMNEGEPQLADTGTGEAYLVFDVADVIESATAPLDEIREDVALAWRRDQGLSGAGAAASRVLERIEQGESLAAAMAAEEVQLPPVEDVSLARQEIARMGRVAPVTVLFFSMAEGTTKRLEQGESDSWFVVQLDAIETPELAADDPSIAGTQGELSTLAGEEYIDQLISALEGGMDVEINQAAVDAVIAQLTGQNP